MNDFSVNVSSVVRRRDVCGEVGHVACHRKTGVVMQVRKFVPALVIGSAGLFTSMAHAALDTAVATELASAKTDVLAIGALVFGIAVGIVLYKWFKRAL